MYLSHTTHTPPQPTPAHVHTKPPRPTRFQPPPPTPSPPPPTPTPTLRPKIAYAVCIYSCANLQMSPTPFLKWCSCYLLVCPTLFLNFVLMVSVRLPNSHFEVVFILFASLVATQIELRLVRCLSYSLPYTSEHRRINKPRQSSLICSVWKYAGANQRNIRQIQRTYFLYKTKSEALFCGPGGSD